MAYTQKTKVEYSDTSNLDAFGRLRTSDTIQVWEGKMVNGAPWGPDLFISADKSGLSDVDYNANSFSLNFTGAGNTPGTKRVLAESAYHLPYQSGRSSLCMFTFSNFAVNALSKVIKRIGLYHDLNYGFGTEKLDGFYFESSQTGVSFNVDGNIVNFSLPINQWSNEDYPPNSIDWTDSQIGWIDYEWLGVGRIRFGLVIDGVPRKFGEFSLANDPRGTGIKTATTSLRCNQKFRQEMVLGPTQHALSKENFIGYCQTFMIEGGMNSISRTYQHYSSGATTADGVMTGILGFKIPRVVLGETYWTFADLDEISAYTIGASSKPSFLFVLYVPDGATALSGTWATNPTYGINGQTGATGPLLHYVGTPKNFTRVPYQILASYPISEGVSQITAPKNILAHPGIVQDPDGSGAKYGTMWIAVISGSNTTNHFISANWKCIT